MPFDNKVPMVISSISRSTDVVLLVVGRAIRQRDAVVTLSISRSIDHMPFDNKTFVVTSR
jgi:hypothetical protein